MITIIICLEDCPPEQMQTAIHLHMITTVPAVQIAELLMVAETRVAAAINSKHKEQSEVLK